MMKYFPPKADPPLAGKKNCHSDPAHKLSVGRTISFTPLVILNEAERSEEPPYAYTGVFTGRFFAEFILSKANVLSITIVLLCIGVFLFIPLLGGTSFAQLVRPVGGQNKTEVIDGRRYYIHTVVKGETLYAISRKYGVEIKIIALENPLTINVLKTGSVIKIPVPVRFQKPARPLDGKYIFHTIEYGETLYSLSKDFLVSIDGIKSANPEIMDGLKAGTVIRIPIASQVATDPDSAMLSGIYHPTKDFGGEVYPPSTDTLAAGDTILNVQSDRLAFRDVYNVGLMLPFYLDINDSIARNKEIYEPDKIHALSAIALEFYEGALIAVDSLEKQGLSVRLFIFDTKKDTVEVMRLLQKEESLFINMDLIIGPLYRSNLSIVANFPKKDNHGYVESSHDSTLHTPSVKLQIFKSSNHLHIVSPFITTNDILRGNPHLSKAMACLKTHVEKIASYITHKYLFRSHHNENKNIIVVYNEFDEAVNGRNRDEKMLSDVFKTKLLSSVHQLAEHDTTEHSSPTFSLRQIAYNEREMEALEEVLSITDTNVIVIPSRDQVFVSKLISKLNELKDDYNMILFGLPVWKNFSNIEIEYLHNLNVHIASPSYIDYESEEVKSFIKHFFRRYHTFPGNYAFHGFDIVYYYLNTLKNFGYNFQAHLPEITNTGLQTSYEYFKTGVEDGYENQRVVILKYEDYELKPAGKQVGEW